MDFSDEIIIVIPARGGSKRLLKKNLLELGGKPLICWTIESAVNANFNSRIIVSSDDDEILKCAKKYEHVGVIPYKRNSDLATDESTTIEVIIDVIKSERESGRVPSVVILLQPTSPLRTSQDIIAAMGVFKKYGYKDTVVSVSEVDHPSAWIGKLDKDSVLHGIDFSGKRSQEHIKEFRLNGSIYIFLASVLKNKNNIYTDTVRASVIPRSRSVDIDEAIDFKIAEVLLPK